MWLPVHEVVHAEVESIAAAAAAATTTTTTATTTTSTTQYTRVWLLVDEAVHTEVESVLHASAALRALVGLRVAGHVHQQVLLRVEATLTHPTLQLVARYLQQRRLQGVLHCGRVFRGSSGGSPGLGVLERAHVMDADVPSQLLDRRADLRTNKICINSPSSS